MRKFSLALLLLLAVSSPAICATPSQRYRMDSEGSAIWRGKTKVADVANLPLVEGSVYQWLYVSGNEPAVWVFSPYDTEYAVFLPMKDDEECLNVYLPDEAEVYALVLDSGVIAVYSFDGRRLYETPGEGPLYWIDGFRCLYTTHTPGKRRGRGMNSHSWLGAAVLEVFLDGSGRASEFLVTPVAEPDSLTDYRATGLDGNQCIIRKEAVRSPAQWNNPGRKMIIDELRINLPAAG